MFSHLKKLSSFFWNKPVLDKKDIVVDLGEANLDRSAVSKTNTLLSLANRRELLFKTQNAQPYTDDGVFRPEESTYPPGTVLCRIA
jgi:hypothetical protein